MKGCLGYEKGECKQNNKAQKDLQRERINEFTMREADRLRRISRAELHEWQSLSLRPTKLSAEDLATSSK